LSVEVKRALSHVAGDVLLPARAQLAIREAAQSAVEGAMGGRFAPYVGEPAPYEIEVELRQPLEPSLRENLARLPEFEIADEHTVRTLADDMDLGFRRIAYLGYGHAPGQVRY
jgi:D-aminopeptidase